MTSRPWMPWYIGDYRRKTGHLTTLEHGAYLLLIAHYWERGPIPDDDQELAAVTLMTVQRWRRIRLKLVRFFNVSPILGTRWEASAKQLVGNYWMHTRIDDEIEKAENIRLKRKIAGQRGGLVSRGKTNDERFASQAIAKHKGAQSQRKIYRGHESFEVPSPISDTNSVTTGSLTASPSLVETLREKGWA